MSGPYRAIERSDTFWDLIHNALNTDIQPDELFMNSNYMATRFTTEGFTITNHDYGTGYTSSMTWADLQRIVDFRKGLKKHYENFRVMFANTQSQNVRLDTLRTVVAKVKSVKLRRKALAVLANVPPLTGKSSDYITPTNTTRTRLKPDIWVTYALANVPPEDEQLWEQVRDDLIRFRKVLDAPELSLAGYKVELANIDDNGWDFINVGCQMFHWDFWNRLHKKGMEIRKQGEPFSAE